MKHYIRKGTKTYEEFHGLNVLTLRILLEFQIYYTFLVKIEKLEVGEFESCIHDLTTINKALQQGKTICIQDCLLEVGKVLLPDLVR